MEATQASEYTAFLQERRTELLQRIAEAAQRSGRNADEVTLLAVSKTVGNDEVALAAKVGYDVFGENRPQELKHKVGAARQSGLAEHVSFHMIGNLQRNKVNQVLECASMIHSVSSEHLAQAISSRADARGIVMPCLLEVNVSGEASKSGFSCEGALQACERLVDLPGIELTGLMTMAPAYDQSAARKSFSGLRELRDKMIVRTGLALPVLSCGMSGDYTIAVEEGSTLVRLGRIVFDPAFFGA